MAKLNFNANEVEPATEYEALPTGKYLAVIVDSTSKPTSSKNGEYLELKFQVIDGKFKGKVCFSRLNLDNPNQQAVDIARRELSAICHAVGIMQPDDSVELHDKPLVISVRAKKREDNGELTNEIRGYSKKEVATGQPQQSTGSAPWSRN